ncbi:MAG: type 1 glutamine amidotransferase domain-containing protein [Rhizobiaceae bacterium]
MEKNNTILIICTSHEDLGGTGNKTGFWFEELAAPYLTFKNAGYDVEIASPKGGMPPIDPGSNSSDFRTEDVVKFESDTNAMAALQATSSLSDISNASEYVAVFLVGGHGTMWDFADNADLKRLLTPLAKIQLPIGAVCHGVAGLLSIEEKELQDFLSGRLVTSFSNGEEAAVGLTEVVPMLLEDSLKNKGGRYIAGDIFAPHIVVDGSLVTGQNPASSKQTAVTLIEVINGTGVAK